MKKFVGLLIVVGLVAVAYVNRDMIAAWRSGAAAPNKQVETVDGAASADGQSPDSTTATPAGPATPHPAKEAQAQASKLYPGLLIPSSPLNKRFLALHAEAQMTDPKLLSQPDWPLTLAERAMVAMGGSPLPRTTPAPAVAPRGLHGSALDAKPKK